MSMVFIKSKIWIINLILTSIKCIYSFRIFNFDIKKLIYFIKKCIDDIYQYLILYVNLRNLVKKYRM